MTSQAPNTNAGTEVFRAVTSLCDELRRHGQAGRADAIWSEFIRSKLAAVAAQAEVEVARGR